MGAKEEMQHLFCHIHAPEGIPDNDKKSSNYHRKTEKGWGTGPLGHQRQ